MSRLRVSATILAAVLLLTAEGGATIIDGAVSGGTAATAGGTFLKLTTPLANPFGPPDSVGNDTFQSPNLFGFEESLGMLVGPGGLSVDVTSGGGPGTISAGVRVDSHYVFFDPGPSESQLGFVDFGADILAVISGVDTLAASDYLGAAGVTYLDPSARGLEAGDSATIDPTNRARLLVDWVASSPGDYVRVLTLRSPAGSVPDAASTSLLLGCGIALLAGFRRWGRWPTR